jgi:hypothetical protein
MQWACRPILGCKFNAPESRRRREKFQANSLAFLTGIAKIHHATLLIFFCGGVAERYLRAQFDRRVQVDKSAVRIHHDGLAGFAEFAAIRVPAARMHGKPGKHPGAAALLTGVRVRCFQSGHPSSLHDAQIAHKRQARPASQRINSRKTTANTCCPGLPSVEWLGYPGVAALPVFLRSVPTEIHDC